MAALRIRTSRAGGVFFEEVQQKSRCVRGVSQVASEEGSACRDSGIHYLREVIASVKLLLKVTADESALSRNHRDA